MAGKAIKKQKDLLRERKENSRLGDIREGMLEILFHKNSGNTGPLRPEHHRGESTGGHGVTLEMKALPRPRQLVLQVQNSGVNLRRDLKSFDMKKKHRKLRPEVYEAIKAVLLEEARVR